MKTKVYCKNVNVELEHSPMNVVKTCDIVDL